jgi:uncharacterized repeat protein (TIGR01451 family)
MNIRKLFLAAVAAAALTAAIAAPAQAAKVANPGGVSLTFNAGALDIGSQHFDAASSDDPITATGTVQANGAMSFSNFHFPPLPPVAGPLGDVNISITVQGTPTGNVNPLTGAMNLSFTVRIDADGTGLGGDCHISPVTINASTANSGGVPYNPTNGVVTMADHTFSVPGASGCSTFPINVNNEINSQLGLPSGSGNNHGVFTATSTPILGKAIAPAFSTTPSNGSAPLPVSFDASSTFHTRPVSNYQWDFTNNGSFDASGASPTTSFTYTTPGTYTARLRVTDQDGDVSETTRQVVVSPAPDLALSKSHTGDFVGNAIGTYAIDVTNAGAQAATGTVTVTDPLPADMAFAGSSGSGWNCGAAGQLVTCTSDDDIPAGGNAAPLTIDVTPGPASVGVITNTASVDVAGDVNASNDSGSDETRVLQAGIDAAIVKSHDTADGFFRGHRATYILSVRNAGTAPASDRFRADDVLPAGVSFVSAAGGSDWTCSYTAPAVHCFADRDLAAGEALADIRIRVDVLADAPSSISNTATTSVNGDTNAANDSSTADVSVEGFAADLSLSGSHDGDFVTGEPGTYTLDVSNVGFATAGNPITVVDQLPAGTTYTGSTGDGWSCAPAAQEITCTHAGQVEAGDSLPSLELQVDVTAPPGSITNTAGVSSADDFNTANDVASDPTTVRGSVPNLGISKSHTGNFTAGQNGTYTIAVSNSGPDAAHGPITVTDPLPTGMTFVSGSGAGWACGALGQNVTCTRNDQLGAGETTSITLVVAVDRLAAANIVNVANVASLEDNSPGNNSDSDPTQIDQPALIATKLNAEPMSFTLGPGGLQPGHGTQATLTTADGHPLAGKEIVFTYRVGILLSFGGPVVREICRATTNAAGVARCTTYPKNQTWFHYFANFNGDLDYAPSQDEQGAGGLGGLRLF